MSNNPFSNRCYGAVVVKAINSNYNADFSGQPRTLPDGNSYATDKALKYLVRNYWKNVLNEPVFYFKRLKENLAPHDLVGLYNSHYESQVRDDDKLTILQNLLSALDIRLFGATFAPKGSSVSNKNISIHGSCQITHGVNRFHENAIFSEQIMAPVATPPKAKKEQDNEDNVQSNEQSGATTLGNQSKIKEGHYVHHFSLNPQNIADFCQRAEHVGITEHDISQLKKALCRGATYYDSAAKAGTENELMLWVQLREDADIVLPSFVELISITEDRKIDLQKVKDLLSKDYIKDKVESIELYYEDAGTTVINAPEDANIGSL